MNMITENHSRSPIFRPSQISIRRLWKFVNWITCNDYVIAKYEALQNLVLDEDELKKLSKAGDRAMLRLNRRFSLK